MPTLSELDLPQIDLFDPALARDPIAVYAEARKKNWIAKYQFGYILLDAQSMRDFLRNDAQCREPNLDIVKAWKAQGTPFERFTSHQLVALRGKEHKRIRDLVAPAFTPRAANQHRLVMRETLERILDSVAPSGKCDFTRVSAQYPITVMCHLIGVPPEDITTFETWLEPGERAFGQDPSILPVLNEATQNILDYVTRLIDQRRMPGEHPDDLLQSLVSLATAGDKLSDEELRLLLALLLGGGYDTSKNQLNLILKQMIDRPQEWAAIAANPARAKAVIEESLRFQNVIGALHRVTEVEITYRDVVIPANTFLSIPITFHGRDPALNAAPDEFNPDRQRVAHFTFGQGEHFCLGMYLARALLEEALPILARRLQRPRLSGPITYRTPMGIWGYTSLPIEFEPEAARTS
jgi:cytochrome P450